MKWLHRLWNANSERDQEEAITDAMRRLEDANAQYEEIKEVSHAMEVTAQSIEARVEKNHFGEGIKLAWGLE